MSVGIGSGLGKGAVSGGLNSGGKPTINNNAPPPMKTLVYAPSAGIIIAKGNRQYDVSGDLVAGGVLRPENATASLQFTCNNRDLRYNGLFDRMDRVILFLKRIKSIQVFSGYLDDVPYLQLYPGTVTFRATCTMKRLKHTWWDPSLTSSAALFQNSGGAEAQVTGDGTTAAGTKPIGSILRDILTEVGGWDPDQIHIENFPRKFLDMAKQWTLANAAHDKAQLDTFLQQMLGDDHSAGVGATASANPALTLGPTVIGAPGYIATMIKVADEMGLGPTTSDLNVSQQIGDAAGLLSGSMDSSTQSAGKALEGAAQNWNKQYRNNDAAILALACSMVETEPGPRNLANPSVEESVNYPNDGMGSDGTSVGLYQQISGGQWGDCLPASAQVFTANGPVRIADMSVGDEVWSYDGTKMITAKVTGHAMTGHKPLLTIKTAGRELQVSASHRIPVRRYFGVKDGRKYGNQHKKSTCGWETLNCRADDVREGDYLVVPHGMGDGDRTIAPDGRKLTVGLMEFLGLYLGDGNVDNKRIEIAHARDEDHLPHYRRVIEAEFGVPTYTKNRETGPRTRFNSPKALSLIQTEFPGDASTKRLPGWVFRLTSELQLALLRGYLDSDGSVDELGRISITSVSRDLAEGFRHLCIQLGIPVGRVGVREKKENVLIRGRICQAKEAYSIRLTSTRHNLHIGSNSPRKKAKFAISPKQLRSRYDEDWNSSICRRQPMGAPAQGAVYHRVISVAHDPAEVPVYDIEVAGPAHFVADGVVVHNCAQRMNPEAATRGFLLALSRIDWRNMDPGTAIQAVQRSAFPGKYGNFIQPATQAIQAARGAQNDVSSLTGANATAASPLSPAGLIGTSGDIAALAPSTGTMAGGSSPTSASALAGAQKPNPDAMSAIAAALSYVGSPYDQIRPPVRNVGVDCSGLTSLAYRAINIDIGGNTYAQLSQLQGRETTPAQLQPGDLIYPSTGHVFMWLGTAGGLGGGNMILESSGSGWDGNGPVPDGPQVKPNHYDINNMHAMFHIADFGGWDPTVKFNEPSLMGPGYAPGTFGTSNIGTGYSADGSGGAGKEPIARNLFTFQFNYPAFAPKISPLFDGERSLLNCSPLIEIVQALCKATLRNWCSSPTGDFTAWYPDYFGLEGKQAVMYIEDIEMKDVSINLNDYSLITHAYVAAQTTGSGMPVGPEGWLTSGVATVENESLFQQMIRVAPKLGEGVSNGNDILTRFGARPFMQEYDMVWSPELKQLLAIHHFMEGWANQFASNVEFTFMPELFPGMRINLRGHNLQVYVTQVQHTFSYQAGFKTQATVTAPSSPRGVSEMLADVGGGVLTKFADQVQTFGMS